MKKKTIIFVESSPTDFSYKIAKALKEKGHKTILVSFLNYEGKIEAYNEIANIGLDSFSINIKNFFSIMKKIKSISNNLLKLKRLNPDIIIGTANPYPLWLPALVRKFTKNIPFVFFEYDVNILKYKGKKNFHIAGVRDFELMSEKYLFKKSDGFIFKGGEHEYIHNKVNLKSPSISFQPYCSEEEIIKVNRNKLSKKDGSLHFVYLGYVENEEQKESFGNKSWVPIIESIINQKMHFHLYTISQYNFILNSKEFENLRKSEYFHVYPKVPNIVKDISKYDYGIWFPRYDENIFTEEWLKTGLGHKMSVFLEAGLPFIYSKKLLFIDKIMKEYKLDLGFKEEDINNLKFLLKRKDYSKLIKNVELLRKDFTYSKNVSRLSKFFDRVIKEKV